MNTFGRECEERVGGRQLESTPLGWDGRVAVKTGGFRRIWAIIGCVSRPQERGWGRGRAMGDLQRNGSPEVKVQEKEGFSGHGRGPQFTEEEPARDPGLCNLGDPL